MRPFFVLLMVSCSGGGGGLVDAGADNDRDAGADAGADGRIPGFQCTVLETCGSRMTRLEVFRCGGDPDERAAEGAVRALAPAGCSRSVACVSDRCDGTCNALGLCVLNKRVHSCSGFSYCIGPGGAPEQQPFDRAYCVLSVMEAQRTLVDAGHWPTQADGGRCTVDIHCFKDGGVCG